MWPLWLLGCMAGPNPETLIDELRVVAMVAEPPVVAVTESSQVTVHVVDPGSAGFDLFFWTCASLGQGCLEDQLGLDPRATIMLGAQGPQTMTVELPDLSAVEGWGEELFPVSLWALVCTSGTCEFPLPQEVLELPTAWMEEQPLQGVSLARKSLWLSGDAAFAATVSNPVLQPLFELSESAVSEEKLELSFSVTGDEDASFQGYGYASAGGFSKTEVDVFEEQFAIDWYAPQQSGQATLYMVVQGELGRTALWSGDIQVEQGEPAEDE